MKIRVSLLAVLAVVLILGACHEAPEPPVTEEAAAPEPAPPEPKEDPTPGEVVATGVFMGRSGKPMARARLVLGELVQDDQLAFATVKLVDNVSTAVADADGKFQFKGFTPGKYTIAYQPAGKSRLFPTEFRIRTLSGTDKSIAPLLKNVELGKDRPFSNRAWGRRYTLLEGHTLYSKGTTMTIWNASVLHKPAGPHLEMRKGALWTVELEDNSEIELEGWSF